MMCRVQINRWKRVKPEYYYKELLSNRYSRQAITISKFFPSMISPAEHNWKDIRYGEIPNSWNNSVKRNDKKMEPYGTKRSVREEGAKSFSSSSIALCELSVPAIYRELHYLRRCISNSLVELFGGGPDLSCLQHFVEPLNLVCLYMIRLRVT